MFRVLVALLALVAVLGIVLWRVGSSGPRRSAAAQVYVDAPSQERTSAVELVAPAATEGADAHPSPSEATARAPAREETSSAEREAELARAQWVEGRVTFPPGTPPDEELFVTADGRDFEDGSNQRVRVGRDGSFRVAFSEKTRSGRLVLEGRYLYLPDVVRWKPDAPQPVVLEPRLGGRILARIVAPSGVDAGRIGGVLRLSVNRSESGGPWYEERGKQPLAADSATAFDALAPGQELTLLYDGDAFVGRSAPVAVEAGKAHAIEIALRRGVVLAGGVRDEQRAPLAGVEVNARAEGRVALSLDGKRHAETAADGSFRLPALVPGKLDLEAELEGYVPAHLELGKLEEGVERTDLELVLARGGSISGVVRWPDGTPAEASVEASPHMDPRSLLRRPDFDPIEAKCDADGRFRITGLSEGAYLVRASATKTDVVQETSKLTGRQLEKKKRAKWSAERDGVTADSGELDLVLSAGLVISGRVLDDRGVPLSEFRVWANRVRDDGAFLFGNAEPSRLYRDADGSFALEGLEPGTWRLYASSDGHAGVEGVVIEVPAAAPVELVLPREARVSGVVLDAGGAPCAGAEVKEVRSGAGLIRSLGDDEDNRTDAQGRFELGGFPTGRIVLVASGSAGAPSEPLELELVAGETHGGLVLHLRPGATLVGEVVDSDGRPESDVNVYLYSSRGGFSNSLATDASGRFEARGLPPGELRVTAQTHDGLSLHQSVTVSEGETAHVRLVAPRVELVHLRGRLSAGGEPLARAFVYASRAERQAGETTSTSSPGQADAEGAYEISLAAGRYNLMIQSSSFSWRTPVDVPAVAEFTFDIAIPCGRVSGRVTDSSGAALKGIRVRSESQRRDGAASGSGNDDTDGEGRYELLLPAGTHALTAGGVRSRSSEGERQYALARVEDVTVGEGGHVRGIDFELREGGILAGTVRSADGVPVGRAQVWTSEGEGTKLLGMSGSDGSFRFGGLATGALWVGATSESQAARAARVVIEAGKTASVDFALASATILCVRVRDASGAAVGAGLEVLDADGRSHPQRVNPKCVGFGPLPPGRYTVRARRQEKAAERAIELTGTEPETELELVLQ